MVKNGINNVEDIVVRVSRAWLRLILKLVSEILKPVILLQEIGLIVILW